MIRHILQVELFHPTLENKGGDLDMTVTLICLAIGVGAVALVYFLASELSGDPGWDRW